MTLRVIMPGRVQAVDRPRDTGLPWPGAVSTPSLPIPALVFVSVYNDPPFYTGYHVLPLEMKHSLSYEINSTSNPFKVFLTLTIIGSLHIYLLTTTSSLSTNTGFYLAFIQTLGTY
jgi:hypothetical protein